MQGDVVPARHGDGYRFQAARPMEGDELVNPPQGAFAEPDVSCTEGIPHVPSPARRERARVRAPSSSGQERWRLPQNLAMGRILVFRPVKRRKSTADRRRSDAKTLRLREADKSA